MSQFYGAIVWDDRGCVVITDQNLWLRGVSPGRQPQAEDFQLLTWPHLAVQSLAAVLEKPLPNSSRTAPCLQTALQLRLQALCFLSCS